MQCPRCGGRLTSNLFQDLQDNTGLLHFTGLRCIPCGEVLGSDSVLDNRLMNYRRRENE